MNSNYEWQKYQANERVQRSLQDAASHRRSSEGSDRRGGASLLLTLALLAGLFFLAWFITGCSPDAVSALKPEPVNAAPIPAVANADEWSMADRVSFQDKREVYLDDQANVEGSGWTVAGRIHFQDKREAYLGRPLATGWTMAERIRFHDRVLTDGH